ncbi:MAG: hypothetical protein V4474_03725 [Patescibacteria group bacterium]
MDELELSGRRHISTKRAGKEHGYHSDYIGQLIRGEKVAGQKVGRSWYVDEESLRVYLGKNPVPEVPSQKSSGLLSELPSPAEDSAGQTFAPELPTTAESVLEIEEEIEIKKPEVVAEVVIAEIKEEPVEIKKVVPAPKIEENKEENKIEIHIPRAKNPIVPSGGLTYLPDDEPLLPTVRTRATDEETASVVESEDSETISAPRRSLHVGRTTLVVLLALVVVGLSATASAFISATTTVAEGQTASVHYSLWSQ